MKKMKLAVFFAALVSVLTFSSCLDSNGDGRQEMRANVTVVGDELIGYKLYADGGGILVPTVANMKQIGDWSKVKRALVYFQHLDDPLPEFKEDTKYNVQVTGEIPHMGVTPIIDTYQNEDADTLMKNQDPITDFAIDAYKGYVTVFAQFNHNSSEPVYFNMGYDSSKDVDIDNNTLTLTLYYDNGSNDVYNSQQYTYCSFPFSSEFYGKFATDSLDLVVKAASDRGSNYTEKKIKMAVKDFIAPREY